MVMMMMSAGALLMTWVNTLGLGLSHWRRQADSPFLSVAAGCAIAKTSSRLSIRERKRERKRREALARVVAAAAVAVAGVAPLTPAFNPRTAAAAAAGVRAACMRVCVCVSV